MENILSATYLVFDFRLTVLHLRRMLSRWNNLLLWKMLSSGDTLLHRRQVSSRGQEAIPGEHGKDMWLYMGDLKSLSISRKYYKHDTL